MIRRPTTPELRRGGLAAVRLLAVTGAAAGVVYAAASSSWSASLATANGPAPSGAATAIPVSAAEVVCPGRELSGLPGVKDQAVPAQVTVAVPPRTVLDAASATPSGTGSVTIGVLGGPGIGSMTAVGAATVAAPTLGAVDVAGAGALAPGLVAAQYWTADAKDLRGLVGAACTTPEDDLWLVGGGGAAGRQERLVLVNPGANPAVVDVFVYGAKGLLETRNSTGIVVPGRGRTALLLDALALGEPAPVVHVVSHGGVVAATLSDTWLDGSVAAGAADAAPTTAPSTKHLIPGVALSGPATLRVAVVGDAAAVVKAVLHGPGGVVPLPGGVANVAAHTTGEIALNGAPDAVYSVEVTSDVPIVVGAITTRRAGSAPGDFAWASATAPLGALSGAAFPADPAISHTLALTSSAGRRTVEVTTTTAAGVPSSATVEVPADATVTWPVPAGATALWVRPVAGAGHLRGALLSTAGDGPSQLLAWVPLVDTALTTPTARVYPLP